MRTMGSLLGAVLALAGAARAADGLLEDPAAVAAHVEKSARPLDWREVFAGPERVIYLAERHTDPRPKAELAAHLKEAAAAGITTLAVEMLDEDRRALLDRFAGGRATEAELAAAFAADWGPEDKGFLPGAYAKTLAAAREAGLAVVPMNVPAKERAAAWDECMDTRTEADCDAEELASRDARMAAALKRVLRKPGRVLAWTGAWHACALQQPQALRRAGVASRSYYVLTKGAYEREGGLLAFVEAVEAKGWAGRRLLIPTGGAHPCFAGLISEPGADVPPAKR